MTTIINLNKHTINVVIDGEMAEIAPSGQVATVSVKSVQVGSVNGIPLFRSEYGDIVGLPEPQDGVLYLVNMLVGQRAASLLGRTDLIGPDSGPSAIRENGQVKAVTQFVLF